MRRGSVLRAALASVAISTSAACVAGAGASQAPTTGHATTKVRVAPIATQASADIVVFNGSLGDTVTFVQVTPAPGSTFDFRLYGPDDDDCSRKPVFEALDVALAQGGLPVSSPAFEPAATGTYRWIATYDGDAANGPIAGLCNDANEQTVVRGDPLSTGDIAGRVGTEGGESLWHALVEDCPLSPVAQPCHVKRTDVSGQYAFLGVAAGQHRISVWPAADDDEHATASVSPVAAVAGQRAVQDFALVAVKPVPPTVTVTSPFLSVRDGVPRGFEGEPISFSTFTCQAGNVHAVVRFNGQIVSEADFAHFDVDEHIARLSAEFTFRQHGAAEITLTTQGCPAVPASKFNVWIDPSGRVLSARDGLPIDGATVRLLRSDVAAGPLELVADGSAEMSPSNRRAPDTTNAAGMFGWDVIAGYYVVQASKPGCQATPANVPGAFPGTGSAAFPAESPATTPLLTIPPPVTDLEIRLDCGGPKAHASRTALDFPPTAPGQTSEPQSFVVDNRGAERLHLTPAPAASTGDVGDFVVTNDCPAAIDPGGSCTVTARFAPQRSTGGSRTSRIALAGDGDGPAPAVTLSGTVPAATPPPAAPPPPAPPRSANAKLAAGIVKAVTRVSSRGDVTFACRLSVVGAAKACRIALGKLGRGSGSRFQAVRGQTAKLVDGRATIRLHLSRSARARLRAAGRDGVPVPVRVQALDAAGRRLAVRTRRTRLRLANRRTAAGFQPVTHAVVGRRPRTPDTSASTTERSPHGVGRALVA